MAIIQILEMSGGSFRINTEGFNSVLEKVGDLPVAIISMNGSSREGKSYALNFFIRYLKSRGSPGWFDTPLKPEEMFSFKSGRERETVGINLYPEPFIITGADEKKTAVLLLDCQGLFDDKTTFKQNAVIFALSNLFSSVLIYNVKSKIEENLLQNIQFFSSYAQAIKDQDRQDETTTVEQEKLPPLMFLVRDFLFDYEYPLGYHSETELPRSEDPAQNNNNYNNYYKACFSVSPEMPLENQTMRQEILTNFQKVHMFLMPFPGKDFLLDSVNNSPDEEFQQYLSQFVALMNTKEFLIPKLNDRRRPTTGKELQEKVKRWSILCQESASKFPDAQTLHESQTIMRNEIAILNSINLFSESFDKLLQGSKGGLREEELSRHYELILAQALKTYTECRKSESSEVIQANTERLTSYCREMYQNYYSTMNQEILRQVQCQSQQLEADSRNAEVIQSMEKELAKLKKIKDEADLGRPLLKQEERVQGASSSPTPSERSQGPPVKPKRKSPPRPNNNGVTQHNTSTLGRQQPLTIENPAYVNIDTIRCNIPAPKTESTAITPIPLKTNNTIQGRAPGSDLGGNSLTQEPPKSTSKPGEAGPYNAGPPPPLPTTKERLSVIRRFRNFFTKFFVEAPRKMNTRFQSKIIKNKPGVPPIESGTNLK